MQYQNLNLVRLPIPPHPRPVPITGCAPIAGLPVSRKRQCGAISGKARQGDSPQNPHKGCRAVRSVMGAGS